MKVRRNFEEFSPSKYMNMVFQQFSPFRIYEHGIQNTIKVRSGWHYSATSYLQENQLNTVTQWIHSLIVPTTYELISEQDNREGERK